MVENAKLASALSWVVGALVVSAIVAGLACIFWTFAGYRIEIRHHQNRAARLAPHHSEIPPGLHVTRSVTQTHTHADGHHQTMPSNIIMLHNIASSRGPITEGPTIAHFSAAVIGGDRPAGGRARIDGFELQTVVREGENDIDTISHASSTILVDNMCDSSFNITYDGSDTDAVRGWPLSVDGAKPVVEHSSLDH